MSAAETNGRWTRVERPYGRDDVERIRGRFRIEHTLARLGAERLWKLLHSEDHVAALGAMTGAQAVQMVKAGLKAIYVSGWQVATPPRGAHIPTRPVPGHGAPAPVGASTRCCAPTRSTRRREERTCWLAPIADRRGSAGPSTPSG